MYIQTATLNVLTFLSCNANVEKYLRSNILTRKFIHVSLPVYVLPVSIAQLRFNRVNQALSVSKWRFVLVSFANVTFLVMF